jgi:hypothetical protein
MLLLKSRTSHQPLLPLDRSPNLKDRTKLVDSKRGNSPPLPLPRDRYALVLKPLHHKLCGRCWKLIAKRQMLQRYEGSSYLSSSLFSGPTLCPCRQSFFQPDLIHNSIFRNDQKHAVNQRSPPGPSRSSFSSAASASKGIPRPLSQVLSPK